MPLKWKKVWVSDETFESAGIIDVDNDGIPDIVSGGFWYQGPDFRKKHPVGAVKQYGEYFDDFSTIPLDVNGNGKMDVITGGWWGNNAPLVGESRRNGKAVDGTHYWRNRKH